MSEQTPGGDSAALSIEERIEAQMFPEETSEDDVPAEAGSEQAAEEAPALETVEVEGKEYQVPPELKPALLRQQDYTRKTQEIADLRRSAEAAAFEAQARAEFERAVGSDLAQLREIDTQLKQYKSLDWTGLDAESMFKLQRAVESLKDAKAEAEGLIGQKRQQFENEQARHFQQAVQATESFMAKVVPGWNEQQGTELTQYLASTGMSREAIRAIVRDPVQTHVWWKAQQFDKAKAGATTSKSAAPVIKPGASNPAVSQKMANLNLRKQIKNAPTSRDKAALIAKRLEQMV